MTELRDLVRQLAESEKAAEKYADHLKEIFETLTPEKIGSAYRDALAAGDAAKAVALAAAHFREKKETSCPALRAAGDYDLTAADRAVRGEMREVNVDWNFEGGKIDFLFDPTAVKGPRNNEWLWQFNRHGYWAQMARTYYATGDELYAAAFERQLLDWVAQTDCPETDWNGAGSAWRTIECGIRLLSSWQVSFQAFRRSKSVSDVTLLLMLASMRRQVEHLIAHPQGGNWQMMEANGVFAFASLYPEFDKAQVYRRIATERILGEMEKQILPDGMHNELSPDYQSVVFGCAARVYDIACREGFGAEFPQSYVDLMEKTVHAAVLLSTPAFTQPRTNDCYTIRTGVFTGMAAGLLPEKSEYAFVNSVREKGAPPEGKTASAYLPYAGLAVMRSDWSGDAAYLSFDVGPLGRAHIHQDKLNIEVYKGSDELIFDDGGGQYEISPAREYGISAYDHNTCLVDGLAQERKEPLEVTEPIDAGWVTSEEFDYAKGVYDDAFGKEGLEPARHTREVRFEKPDLFIVRDELVSKDERPHEYELLFHLNTTKVDQVSAFPGALLSDLGKTYDILLLPIGAEGEETRVASAETEPRYRGWYVGRNEENQHPATTVSRKIKGVWRHTFTTLLIPVKRGDALPQVEKRGDTLCVTVNGREHVFRPDALDR